MNALACSHTISQALPGARDGLAVLGAGGSGHPLASILADQQHLGPASAVEDFVRPAGLVALLFGEC